MTLMIFCIKTLFFLIPFQDFFIKTCANSIKQDIYLYGMMAFSNMPVNIECILVYVLLIPLLFDFLKLFNKKGAQFYVRTFTLKIKYASFYIRTFTLKISITKGNKCIIYDIICIHLNAFLFIIKLFTFKCIL